jgi:hypothetical protein
MRTFLNSLCGATGCFAIVYGFHLMYEPLGYISLGFILLIISDWGDMKATDSQPPPPKM